MPAAVLRASADGHSHADPTALTSAGDWAAMTDETRPGLAPRYEAILPRANISCAVCGGACLPVPRLHSRRVLQGARGLGDDLLDVLAREELGDLRGVGHAGLLALGLE